MNVDKTIYNFFEQEMIDAGYKIFKSSIKQAIRGFQKRFDDEYGKKYFITIWHWNHKKQNPIWNCAERDTYECETQLNVDKNNKELTVDISVMANVLPDEFNEGNNLTTLTDIEDFFEKTWNDMSKPYYEYWDENNN